MCTYLPSHLTGFAVGMGPVLRSRSALLDSAILPSPHITLTILVASPLAPLTPDATCRFISGDTLVVDGANWMWRPPVVPRSAVAKVSRGVEAKSRETGKAVAGRPVSKL